MADYTALGDDLKILIEKNLDHSMVNEKHDIKAGLDERVLDYGLTHVFPRAEDLIRIAAAGELDVCRTVALVLKGEWELVYGSQCQGWRPDNDLGLHLADVLADASEKMVQEAKKLFPPDPRDIFMGLQSVEGHNFLAGFTEKAFASLISEIVIHNLHRRSIFSPEMETFFTEFKREREIAFLSPEEKQEMYWKAKCDFIEKQDKLGELLIDIENHRLELENINFQWLPVFGKEHLIREEHFLRVRSVKEKIKLKKDAPSLTRKKLETKCLEKFSDSRRKMQNDEMLVALAGFRTLPPKTEIMAKGEDLDRMKEQCKRIANRIWFLTHPDHLKNNAVYEQLTEKQKAYLEELPYRFSQIKISELGCDSNQVGWNRRSSEALLAVLHKVEKILGNAGIDLDVDLIIEGDSLEERVIQLEREIKRLDKGITEANTRMMMLMDDPVTKAKAIDLACPENWDTMKEDILREAAKLDEEADWLEQYLDSLFKREEVNLA